MPVARHTRCRALVIVLLAGYTALAVVPSPGFAVYDDPRVATDAAGDAALLFPPDRGPFSAVLRAGFGPWSSSSPFAFSGALPYRVRSEVVMDAAGNALAAWTGYAQVCTGDKYTTCNDVPDGLWMASRRAGESFAPAVELAGASAQPNLIRLVGNDEGDAFVVWQSGDHAMGSSRLAGGSSGPPIALTASGVSVTGVALDAHGDALLGLYSKQGGVQAADVPAGGAPRVAQTLAAPRAPVEGPLVAVNARGDASALWAAGGAVMVARRAPGGMFARTTTPSVPTLAGHTRETKPVALSIGADASSTIGVSQSSSTSLGRRFRVLAASSSPDGVFGTLVPITADHRLSGVGSVAFRVAQNARGDLAVLTSAIADGCGPRDAFVLLHPAGGSWSPERLLSRHVELFNQADVAIDQDGNATATWVEKAFNQDTTALRVSPVAASGQVAPTTIALQRGSPVLPGAAFVYGYDVRPGRRALVPADLECLNDFTQVCRGRVTLYLETPDGNTTSTRLASRPFAVPGCSHRTVQLRLTYSARRLLARRGELRVNLTAITHVPAGQPNNTDVFEFFYLNPRPGD